MARLAPNGITSHVTGREHLMKKPASVKQADEIFSFVSSLSKDSHQLFDDLTSSLPKISKFLRANWKPIVAVATVGAATYAVMRKTKHAPQRLLAAPKKARARR